MALAGSTADNGAIYVPAPLSNEALGRRWTGHALIDTGAQFAMLHPSVIEELQLRPMGERDIDSAVGRFPVRAFLVSASVADVFDDVLSALESHSKERCILGRQFLKPLHLEVSWPRRRFSIRRVPAGE